MAVGVQTSIVGLATDPNPLQSGTRGALRRARDVVIDQPGMARCRPVFEHVVTKTTDAVPRTLVRFNDETFAVTLEGSDWTLETATADIATGDDATPPQPDLAPTSFAEARESLFYTTAFGVRKVESAASTESTASGVEFFVAPSTYQTPESLPGSDGPFTAPAAWAVRFVGVKTDSHGAIRRSAPSDPVFGENPGTGTGWGIASGDYVHFFGLDAGDLIEAYRTRMTSAVATPPAPDYYLAWTHVVTSTDVTNGYIETPLDVLADDDLRGALYTNPSREGILGGKEVPPISMLLALFAACLWFGNTTEKHRVEISLLDVGGSTGPSTSAHITNSGLLTAYFTGSFTAGSPVVVNVPNVTNIVPGMAINDTAGNGGGSGPTVAGVGIDADTKVLSISGAGPYTLTMTKPALGSGPGNAVACDVLTIAGVEFYAMEDYTFGVPSSGGTFGARCFPVSSNADFSTRLRLTLDPLIWLINYQAIVDPTFTVRARKTAVDSLTLEEVGLGGSSFGTVCTTRPNAWHPDLGAGVTSSNTARPGRLWWSDQDEPEAVPLLQYVDVGSQVDPIIALTPLNAALLIWKRDGLYRLSGVAPDSWRVDVIDPSLRLLRSECVDVMDGVAFAWTNRGVVAVTEGGSVNSISGGLIDRPLLDATRNIVDNTSGTAWLRCHRSRRLVLLAIPADNSDEAIYCWSSVTEAWSTWSITTRCAHYSSREERLYYFSDEASWRLHRDSGASNDRRGFDRGHLLSGWTATAGSTTVTLTAAEAGEWTPRPGHWLGVTIGDDTYALRILSADFDTVWTLELDTAYPSGSTDARVAYEGITGLLEWQPVSAAGPGVAGLWRELQVHMHGVATVLLGSPCRLVMGGRSDLAADVASVANTFDAPQVLSRSYRAGLSRQIGRGHHFYPYVEVNQLQWPWRLSGIGAVYEPVSNKVRR